MSLPDEVSSDDLKNDVEELDGSMDSDDSKDRIMHQILPVQKDIEAGDMINEAVNRGISSFMPNMMFEKITKNFKTAKELYGETILRKLTGYGTEELERNMKIPEFQREIFERVKKSVKEMKNEKVLDEEGSITKRSMKLARLSMLVSLDKSRSKSLFGDISRDKDDIYGENDSIIKFRKGLPSRNLAVKNTIKTALKRGHKTVIADDLRLHTKKSKQRSIILYAIDASGSMSGNKIRVSKEAGLALAYHAIENRDLAGIVAFGKEISISEKPTNDFMHLLESMVNVRAAGKTDFVKALREAHQLLHGFSGTKHVMIISDALPTVGDDPKAEALSEISVLSHEGITVSLIGIGLNEEGMEFAKEAVEISKGKIYLVNNLEELNDIVLEDYRAYSDI